MRQEMASYQQGVGRRLKALRTNRQFSQEDAAHAAKVSLTTWRNWERGLRNPTERNWAKFAKGFELTDEQVAAIRGTPPDPLSVDVDQPTVVEQQIIDTLDEIIERLGRLEDDQRDAGA
jgi:transcriptional regulator with XRE-family HTH domain